MLKKRSTKELIAESTRELMRSSSAETLTVKMIAENCGITPQTFYNHFHDKFEVIARIYIDAMAPYLMCNLNDWFVGKNAVILTDLPFFSHAFSYSGQNSLRNTLVAFDLGKYLLHVPRDISDDSAEMKVIRMGLVSMIYGQFGLFDIMERGQIDLTDEEFDARYANLKEGMMQWAPRIVAGTLLDEPTCADAYWDAEREAVVPIWGPDASEG